MVIERFATYAGADPRRAPAALALAGYVEHAWGAWHPRGGLYALVEALVRRLEALGGELRLGTPARRIVLVATSRARRRAAARAPGGRRRPGSRASRPTRAGRRPTRSSPPSTPRRSTATCSAARCAVRERSVSGLALMLGLRGRTPGLAHHAITFPADYDAEFDDVFVAPPAGARPDGLRQRAVARPIPAEAPPDAEHWFVLVNAPAIGDAADWEAEAERLIDRLGVRDRVVARALRTPGDLERETGGVAGAIYGVAPHGRLGTLRRPADHRARRPRPVARRRARSTRAAACRSSLLGAATRGAGDRRRHEPARRAARPALRARAARARARGLRRRRARRGAARRPRLRDGRRGPRAGDRDPAAPTPTGRCRSCSSCTAGARPSRASTAAGSSTSRARATP